MHLPPFACLWETVYSNLSRPLVTALWNLSLHLQTPRPHWSGMIQTVYDGPHPGTASVMFLPMIDLDPGNMTYIYSALSFISDHAKRYNVVPMVTFKQPLWWKALNIIESEAPGSDLHNIILRLRAFHTLMRFLGCIGRIMGVQDYNVC